MFALLLRNGADPNIKNDFGQDVREHLKTRSGLDAFDRAYANFERERLNQALAKAEPKTTPDTSGNRNELTPEQRAEMFSDVSKQASDIRHGKGAQTPSTPKRSMRL